jgi:hypothetical protein
MISWKDFHSDSYAASEKAISELEGLTKLRKSFQLGVVPALLQTENYARWIMSSSGVDQSPKRHVESAVRERVKRRGVLENLNKVSIFLIYELAFRRGSPAGVMQEQIGYIREELYNERVKVGVVPLEAVLPVLPYNCFNIFDDKLVHAETFSEFLHLRDEWDVSVYIRAFEQLKKASLFGEDADRLLGGIRVS